jgi:outer membrane protein assembly factor BamB
MHKEFNSVNRKILGKQTVTAIALAVLLFISAFVVSIPAVTAHTPGWNIPTYAYLSISPTSIGVGQTAQLVMWLDTIVPTSTGSEGDLFHNFTIAVTAPDGTKQTLGPFTSGSTGSAWAVITPTQVGNYTFVFSWPGQILTNGTGTPYPTGLPFVGDFFMPSTSEVVTLAVTQAPLANWQDPPLPTGYWTLPINGANRGWSSLASNWLKGSWLVGNYQTEGQAPNSSHILWGEPMTPAYPGGILDAQWYGITSDSNDYYFNPWGVPIIMNGIIYANTPAVSNTAKYGYYALNLYTGQQIWYKNGSDNGLNNPMTIANPAFGTGPALAQTFPSLSFGQLFHYYSVNGQGVDSYLWMTFGTTWYMLDATSGNWIMSLTNVPTGTSVTDQDGNILLYSYNAATGRVLAFNTTQAIPFGAPGIGTTAQQWRPRQGATIDVQNDTSWLTYGGGPGTSTNTGGGVWTVADEYHTSYSMNTTLPAGLTPGSITSVLQDSNRVPRLIFGFSNPNASSGITGGNGIMYAWCARINYGVTTYNGGPQNNSNLGYTLTLLWNKTIPPPNPTGNLTYSLGPSNYGAGIFTVFAKETRQWYGFSLTDGSLVWGPTASQGPWDMYGGGGVYAFGNLYSSGYGGVLYCYNMTTGKLQWTYTAKGVGFESPYGNYDLSFSGSYYADGKVYLGTSEHSPTKPLIRGSYLRCVNATTGQEIWKIQNWYQSVAIADGYLVTGNLYDNKVYCYGKGPSATTITATPGLGNVVTIQGTVTDQSPGMTGLGTPTKGTPAVSDSSMDAWMEYLYMQQSKPTNTKGVPVTLTAFDPNNNTEFLGTITSDASGNFAIAWTPPVPGVYKITATFAGTNSYGDSWAETALAVGTTPSAAPAPTPTPLPTQTLAPTTPPIQTSSPSPSQAVQPTGGAPTATYIAIAAAIIVIVVVAAAIALRRRK